MCPRGSNNVNKKKKKFFLQWKKKEKKKELKTTKKKEEEKKSFHAQLMNALVFQFSYHRFKKKGNLSFIISFMAFILPFVNTPTNPFFVSKYHIFYYFYYQTAWSQQRNLPKVWRTDSADEGHEQRDSGSETTVAYDK